MSKYGTIDHRKNISFFLNRNTLCSPLQSLKHYCKIDTLFVTLSVYHEEYSIAALKTTQIHLIFFQSQFEISNFICSVFKLKILFIDYTIKMKIMWAKIDMKYSSF